MPPPSATTGDERSADGEGAADATADGPAKGLDDGTADCASPDELVGVGAAEAAGVPLGAAVGARVGRVVGRTVGLGVEAARTLTTPVISWGWISQKYG